MKAAFTLFCFLLSSIVSQSQVFNSNCSPSGNMEAVFRNDACLLATKRIYDINSPWKDSVIIPEIYIDSMSKALYAIRNMDYSLLKDTIRTIFCFEDFANTVYPNDSLHIRIADNLDFFYRPKFLSITVSNTADWTPINAITNRFNLIVTPASIQIYPDKTSYEVSSPVSLNIIALKNQLLAIPGVIYANTEMNFGSNFLDAGIVNGEVFLSYTLGCGDCLAGCTYGRTWNFRVNLSSDCSVNYISSETWGIIVVIPGLFTLCTPQILSADFTTIKVAQNDQFNLIQWQTASEENVTSYVVERSKDGINFISIGRVPVMQSSPAPAAYSWKDTDLLVGKIYYRIKILTESGSEKYSPVASINIKLQKAIRIYQSYTGSNIINIRFNHAMHEKYTAGITGISGQKIFSGVINVSSESYSEQIRVPESSPGMYIVTVSGKAMQAKQIIYVQGQ